MNLAEKNVDKDILDHVHGSLLGLTIGDAVRTSSQWRRRTSPLQNPVMDLHGGGTWNLAAGQRMAHIRRKEHKTCFDIGELTKRFLLEFKRRQLNFTKDNYIPTGDIDYLRDPKLLNLFDMLVAHGDSIAVDARRYYDTLIIVALHDENKEQLLNESFYNLHRSWIDCIEFHEQVLAINHGSYRRANGYDSGIQGGGYIS
ncbi:unnamed protein product [Adineta ricciae]|uniref:Uncharacterized protein n=1 Tax=Adineta ricciae TaxID=249248 RepID=A0A814F6W6_ADIRI|nr:unnamed protein product [Adineta ricciae]